MEKFEDKSICAKCGGYCCKKCGCDYFVSDFESMKIDYIMNVLNEGRTSIVAFLNFRRLSNDKLICEPILALRARNINRDVIDLLSFKTTCASLEEDGCHFDLENRPSGGAALIPGENMTCHNSVNLLDELLKWVPYQKVLGKIVKKYTGMSVHTKLKEDVENLFYDILMKNYNGVMKAELCDVQGMLPMLKEIYKEETIKAAIRAYKDDPMILERHKN